MKDKAIKTTLAVVRSAIVVAGILLSILIAGRSVANESVAEASERYGALLDQLLYINYGVVIACAAGAIIFGVGLFVLNLKQRMSTVIGLAAFAVMAVISYSLASDEVLKAFEAGGLVVTAAESKLSETGLILSYILGGVSIAAIVAAELTRAFK
ncbi:MAG: hypothetical protein ACO3YQ_03755 [Flavobacteriales bacterium]